MSGNELETDVAGISEVGISYNALKKIFSYTRAVDSEIGGLLVVKNRFSKLPVISDALLYKQTASSCEFELDSDEMNKQMEKIAINTPKRLELIKGWWHSHDNSGTFWSDTDDETFSTFLNIMPTTYGIVVNKSGSIKARVDVKTEVGSVCFRDIKLVPDIGPSRLRYMKEARNKIIEEEEEEEEEETPAEASEATVLPIDENILNDECLWGQEEEERKHNKRMIQQTFGDDL